MEKIFLYKKPFETWTGEWIRQESPTAGVSLDVGCGRGRYHRFYNNQVVGVDLRKDLGPAVVGAADRLPFADGTFSFATAFQCYYYVGDIQKALSELNRVLQGGSQVLVSVSNALYLRYEHCRFQPLPQRHGRRGWAGLFEQAGFSICPVKLPRRYRGAGAWIGNLASWVGSPYNLFKLQKG